MGKFVRNAVIFSATVLAVTVIRPLAAQQAQPAPVHASQQSAGAEVQLDMIVHDSGNKPVLDLQPADLSITDDGQPVTFSQLRLVNGVQQDQPLVTLLFNRPGFTPLRGSEEADALQTSSRLRDLASKFLKQFPEGGFQFSAMSVWGRLQLQQEYSSERKKISNAVAAALEPGQFGKPIQMNPAEQRIDKMVQSGKDAAGTPLGPRALSLADAEGSAIVNSARLASERHGTIGLACLMALVQSQQSVAGRKAIVYFTTVSDLTGITATSEGNSEEVREAIESIVGAANRAGVSIYIVRLNDRDVAGEMSSIANSFDIANNGPAISSTKSGRIDSKQQARASQFASSSEFRMLTSKQSDAAPAAGSLDSLVRDTEGYSFSENESFSPPVKQLIGDLTIYYESSYVPASVNDNKFHAIGVKALRAGLRLRTRSGYLAVPPDTQTAGSAK